MSWRYADRRTSATESYYITACSATLKGPTTRWAVGCRTLMTLLRRGAGSPRSHRCVRVFGAIVPRLPGSPAPRLAKAPLVLLSIVSVLARRVLSFVLLRSRSEHSKDLELVVLRHELSVLRRTWWRLARARIDRPSTRWSRRIRSNCSTLDTPISPRWLVLVDRQRRWGWVRGWGQLRASLRAYGWGQFGPSDPASRLGRPNDPADQVGIVARSHHLHLHIAGPQGTRRRVVPKV